MSDANSFNCKIYVNDEEIYSGALREVPEEFRSTVIDDLCEWAGTLGKRGLNELLYSHLAWYERMGLYCGSCGEWVDEGGEDSSTECSVCGVKPQNRYLYQRDEKLDRIITCVGMITEIKVIE